MILILLTYFYIFLKKYMLLKKMKKIKKVKLKIKEGKIQT